MIRPRPVFLLASLAFLTVWLLTACRGGDENVAFVKDEQVQITCSEECVVHGQCGTLAEGPRAVLANEGGPAVTLQNRYFLDETLVTVVESNLRQLTTMRDGAPLDPLEATPFPHTFYRVSGKGKTAWVSEWCLARP